MKYNLWLRALNGTIRHAGASKIIERLFHSSAETIEFEEGGLCRRNKADAMDLTSEIDEPGRQPGSLETCVSR